MTNRDIGEGQLDTGTGRGTGKMTAGYRCSFSDIFGHDPRRAVHLRLGAACLAVVDTAPSSATSAGLQSISVMTLGSPPDPP